MLGHDFAGAGALRKHQRGQRETHAQQSTTIEGLRHDLQLAAEERSASR
jgi:hypothetical protein